MLLKNVKKLRHKFRQEAKNARGYENASVDEN